ncbi:hypothetical protein AL346_22940 (plasmid) [Chelatococcus sp. CO-6]|uniref:hypothetical protein n=1 Tax=Chelatococcus sp. CO-6 TaxID=1702325 RepID=UPI00069F1558|nr:hypothetical protein [Chelatococcus sp. CO-6]ALA20280.1 hypothetical protein AL346_22940 [Chelatococcus sp. CO-6]
MGDDSVSTIRGTFATREAAERAIEHLVQEHGIDRSDVFVAAADAANTAGAAASERETAQAENSGLDAALRGRIAVSANVSRSQIARAEQAFREAGAADVETG